MSDSDRYGGPQALGLLQLRESAQYARIPVEQRLALVEAALDDGRALADRTCERWGREPMAVAAACRVPVIESDDDAGFGSVTVYADYATRRPAITLYLPAIARLDRLIAQRTAHIYLGIDKTAPIFLAHELYHHFDCTRECAPLSRRHPLRLFGIGRWTWTVGIAGLAEIAAGAYAQHLLGLSFHPKLLDILVAGSEGR